MTHLQWARWLCRRGFHLVSLKLNTKRPAGGPGWQERIITGPSQIRRPFLFNIGVMGGTLLPDGNRLLILDIDGKNGKDGFESLDRLKDTYGEMFRTASVFTPNNGKHLYLTVPAATPLAGIARILDRRGYPGIDLIGHGQYVVAPPSRLRRKRYEWDVYPTETISPAPSWLVDLLKAEGREETPEQEKDSWLATASPDNHWPHTRPPSSLSRGKFEDLLFEMICRYPVKMKGTRDDLMHRAVASLFSKGLRPRDVEAVMVAWHQHFQPHIGTPLQVALRLLERQIHCLQRSIRRGKFKFLPRQHLKACRALPLPADLRAALARVRGDGSPMPPNNKGGQEGCCGKSRNMSSQDRAFLEGVFVLYAYERDKSGNADSFLMTDRQLLDLIEGRLDVRIDPRQLRRIKSRFISKRKRKASHWELLVMEVEGSPGIPSRYRLQELKDLLAQGQVDCVPPETDH